MNPRKPKGEERVSLRGDDPPLDVELEEREVVGPDDEVIISRQLVVLAGDREPFDQDDLGAQTAARRAALLVLELTGLTVRGLVAPVPQLDLAIDRGHGGPEDHEQGRERNRT